MGGRTRKKKPPPPAPPTIAVPPSPSPAGCGPAAAAEFVVSACVLCVCCPLSLLWCGVKFPVLVAWRGARRLSCCCRGGSHCRRRRGLDADASSSSFSDIDFDAVRGRVAEERSLRRVPARSSWSIRSSRSFASSS